jgi:hypothetical protein
MWPNELENGIPWAPKDSNTDRELIQDKECCSKVEEMIALFGWMVIFRLFFLGILL